MDQLQMAYNLNEQGVELFKQGDYAAAAELFEQAVELGGAGIPMYLTNLGHAHAKMRDWENAVFYTREALRYDADFELAQQRLTEWLFSFGQQLHHTKKYYQARFLYAEALVYKPLEDFWHSELRKTVLPPKKIPEISLVGFPNTLRDSVYRFATTLLYFYQEIQQHVRIFWANEATEQEIPHQEIPGIAHSFPDKDEDGAIVCHNIILNANHYQDATVIEIMGDVAHELAHEAWKAKRGNNVQFVPPFDTDDFTYSTNEWITDLQVLYRGFGAWLLKSREYASRRGGLFAFTEQYKAMKPIDIRRRLRTVLERQGQQAISRGAAIQKGEALGDATKEIMKAQRIWQHVLLEDPAYAYGHYELAVAYGWLDNWQQALTHASQAVTLEPTNRRFAKYLQEVIAKNDSIEEQRNRTSQLMQQAISIWQTDQEKARKLFAQAVVNWQEILARVPSYAFALHEVGVAYYWLGDYDEAIPHLRLAVRFNPNSDLYYRSLGDAYSQINDHGLAASAYKSAVECNSENAFNHYKLGFALWHQGKLNSAEKCLATAVHLDPTNPKFAKSLNDLQSQLLS